MDLNVLVNKSLAKIEEEGFVEKVVEERLKKTIESTMDDLLNSWSEFGKDLKNQIKVQLNVNLKELDIAGYNHMILNVVKEKLNEATYIQGIEKIESALEDLLDDPQKEYKLSEIIKEMMDHAREYDDREGGEISLHIESGRLIFIYFDEDKDKDRYQCKYKIVVDGNDGRVTSARIDDKKFNNKVIMGGLYGIEEILFKLYTNGSKLIIDRDEIDTEYGYRDEYDD